MIGISKYQEGATLKKKELQRVINNQTKVTSAGTSYLLCDCGNPIHKDRYYLSTINETTSIICPICYYPSNLDVVASSDMGMLIYAPDLTQHQVSSIATMLVYIKQLGGDDGAELVEDIHSVIKKRQDLMESVYGEGSSDPAIFCQFLYSLSQDEYDKRDDFVANLRYLPDESVIKRDVAYYKTNILKNYHPSKWRSLLQSLSNK